MQTVKTQPQSRVAAFLLGSPSPKASPPAYTFQDHAKRCAQAAQDRRVLVQHVQVRMHGATHCGKITGCWTTPDGVDLWRLNLNGPFLGVASLPVSKVTQCSGLDGRCMCAGEGN